MRIENLLSLVVSLDHGESAFDSIERERHWLFDIQTATEEK